jgi:exodeoxyribonuclease-3
MTYNIREGATGREAAVLEVLHAAQPDVIVMQEVLDRSSAQYFADALGLSLTFADSNARTRNVALLSRYPVIAAESFHPFPLLRTLLLATIALPRGPQLNLFGLHLGMIHDVWRTYELSVILKRIDAHAATYRTPFALLTGDFNAAAPGDRVQLEGLPLVYGAVLAMQFRYAPRMALRRIKHAGYLDCYRTCHQYEDGFTLPTFHPSVRLDYFFANDTLADRLRKCEVIRSSVGATASDHYPLVVDFEL